jgi:hypothetical protein
MLSRKTWFFLAALLAGLALWHAFQDVEVVYSRRTLSDGTLFVSAVHCGNGPAMVFAGRYSDDIRGPATQADCLRSGRTQVAEVFGLLVVVGVLIYIGVRFGREPPRPIRQELPDLPKGERGVQGRPGSPSSGG